MFRAYGLYFNTRSHKVVSMFPYAIVHFAEKRVTSFNPVVIFVFKNPH